MSLQTDLTFMLSERSTSRLTEAILFRAVFYLNALNGELWLYNHDNNSLILTANCFSSFTKGFRLQLGESVLKTIIMRDEATVINGTDICKIHPDLTDQNRHCYTIILPLTAQNIIIGAITIRKVNLTNKLTDNKRSILTIFADQAALLIRNMQLLEEARRKAETDSLTGLFNHHHFFELANQEITRASRYNHPLTAIMFDIDHFKKVNDTYGHTTGDKILVTIAKITRQIFRNIDIVGRYGGEEFSVLLPETPLCTALEAAERLRETIASTSISNQNCQISVTISLGLAEIDNPQNVTDLIERADKALYIAKNNGKNRTVVWTPDKVNS
ncbi:MAG: sensor domain-containing diguanylate cyclase [Fibrobacter sp.]|nr:sensor domain-containing diguanylate cyclase [Fibrobacter sp.]